MTTPAYSYSCLKECPVGDFTFSGPGFCIDVCPVGSYISGDQACTSCPENSSTSSTGSTSIDQCICDANFYLDGSTCASCGSGTTTSTGSTSVSQCTCEANSYLGDSSCVSCGSGGTSSSGSTTFSQCSCGAGSHVGDLQCVMECTTSGVAACFASASNGDELELSPGTLSSTDGIIYYAQLTLQNKYAYIGCSNVDGAACVWQGAGGKGVLYIKDNGGTTTLSYLTVEGGDTSVGGGLRVQNSNVVLIIITLLDNSAVQGGAIYVLENGSSNLSLHGCSFGGNTASSGADVSNKKETVVIGSCPSGKPCRPSHPLNQPFTNNSSPLPSPPHHRLCSNPRFRPEQQQR